MQVRLTRRRHDIAPANKMTITDTAQWEKEKRDRKTKEKVSTNPIILVSGFNH